MFAVTIDQKDSRTDADRVGELLDALANVPVVLAFERTVGDEVQGVLDDPDALVQVVLGALRAGGWHVGVGVGDVDEPLPQSTREGRGHAFLLAREAVDDAKASRISLAVRAGSDHNGVAAAEFQALARILGIVWEGRTQGQWEVADLLDSGLNGKKAAEKLGITPGAVSQRRRSGAYDEGREASEALESIARRMAGDTIDSAMTEGEK